MRLDDIARANPAWVAALYEDWQRDPAAVDERWALVFAGFDLGRAGGADTAGLPVADLVHAYRELGHLVADLDPLGGSPREHPLLSLDHLGIAEGDLDRVVAWAPFRGGARGPLRDLLEALRQTYSGALGVEYLGVADKARRAWLEERLEPSRGRPRLTADEQREILDCLLAAEGFEQYCHARWPGQKRFSLEGGEALVPLLLALVEEAARDDVQEIVLGMAHRGRLNVLAHVLGKPYETVFAEFEGTSLPPDVPGDGDVKYHLGYSRDYRARGGQEVHLSLTSNPSHLEAVDPVVQGIVRAKQAYRADRDRRRVTPILLHGDAAVVGQGVVFETLALGTLEGYTTGGTVHVVVNNQIGFTTVPSEYLITRSPSDPAHVVHAPVLHVNADDPEAAVHAGRLAIAYRQAFHADVFLDLVCYRRHGHNELDDPAPTQPVLYEQIRNHPTVVDLYVKRLAAQGIVDEAEVARRRQAHRARLDAALAAARERRPRQEVFVFGGVWRGLGWAGEDWSADTRVPVERLQMIGEGLARLPDGFTPHPRVGKLLDERAARVRAGDRLDWATAELLAYGSLLLEGIPVRLSGQDSVRGTFGQRHAAVYDATDGRRWVSLNHLAPEQAALEAINSPLSEEAVLGFEYGMSSGDPRRLVIWEAQFGDFANGAQVVIDQFIASGESKWQRMSGLVLLLPHGYEGQGPEHSSARPERFLQLAAERNIQVMAPSTPAQFFHALRRQMHRRFRKPLVVMYPKSLLRHPAAVSPLSALADGELHAVLDDPRAPAVGDVRRLLLCSGKVFYLLDEARRADRRDVALVRVEELYPFPAGPLRVVLARYPAATDICWVQEEPANQGPWSFVRPRVEPLGGGRALRYIGREAAASPATGSHRAHLAEDRAILTRALEGAVARPRTTLAAETRQAAS